MRLAGLVLSVALLALPAAADVLPPQEDISDVQKALVGEWRQTALSHMRGHGEGNVILVFGKTDYVMVQFNAVEPSNIYNAHATQGAWSARDMGDGTYEVTLSSGVAPVPGEGQPPELHTIKLTGPDSFDFEKYHGMAASVAPFARIKQ